MNRTELVAAVSLRAGISPAVADQALAGLASVVTEQLVSGGRVALPGFATFETIQRAARTGRNPQTGEPMTIAARRSPRITPGAALKRAVADG